MIARRWSPARHTIAVGAGKGGVGKSTVALNLALALRAHGTVGIVDFDFYGPNIAAMVGIEHTTWTHGLVLARAGRPKPKSRPVDRRGLSIASVGFILGEDQPLGVTGSTLDMLADGLLSGVDWPALDYLVVDLPPGTSSVQHVLARKVALSGALIVVTPQVVAHLDARKAVQMFRHLRVPILGGVENFSSLECPHCGQSIDLFPPAAEDRTIWAMGVPLLARLLFDPNFASIQADSDVIPGGGAIVSMASSIVTELARTAGNGSQGPRGDTSAQQGSAGPSNDEPRMPSGHDVR